MLSNVKGSQQNTNENTIRKVVLAARVFRFCNFLRRRSSCCDLFDSMCCCSVGSGSQLISIGLGLVGFSMSSGSSDEAFWIFVSNPVIGLFFPLRTSCGNELCDRLIAKQYIFQLSKEAVITGVTKFTIELRTI